MSTLTDALRRSRIRHDFNAEADWDEIQLGTCYVICECSEHFERDTIADAHEAWHEHAIAEQVAVVADWLTSEQAAGVASKAVLRERHRRWDHPHQGECITDARAALAALAEHAKGDTDG